LYMENGAIQNTMKVAPFVKLRLITRSQGMGPNNPNQFTRIPFYEDAPS